MPKQFSKDYQPTNRRKKQTPLTDALIKALNKNVEVLEFVPDEAGADQSGPITGTMTTKKVKGVKLIADLMVKECVKAYNQLGPLSSAQVALLEKIQNRIDGPVRNETSLEVTQGPDIVTLPQDMDSALAGYQQVTSEPESEDSDK